MKEYLVKIDSNREKFFSKIILAKKAKIAKILFAKVVFCGCFMVYSIMYVIQ